MCETRADISGWKFNGTLLDELPSETRGDLSTSLTKNDGGSSSLNLTIPARKQYNGTIIQLVFVLMCHYLPHVVNPSSVVPLLFITLLDNQEVYNKRNVD